MNQQLTTQQSGWLRLAEIKTNLFNELQAAELDVQGKLSGITGNTHLADVQATIKDAKATMADAKGKRLAFSRMIDEKLLSPSMDFEKRMAAEIEIASKHELTLRVEAEKEANKAAAYQQEVAAYKAHVTNEWYRIAVEYRGTLNAMINDCYVTLLKSNVPTSKLQDAIDDLANVLRKVELPKPVKFNRSLINDKAAREIVADIRAYIFHSDLEAAIESIPQRFEMYEQDLMNAEAATRAIEQEQAERQAEQAQRLAAEQATNVLIAQAEIAVIDTPKVKREIKIVIVESEQWASTIVANFLKNWQYCNKFIRVKSWAKLSIQQMAEALAKHINETGEQIQGIQVEEVVK